MKGGNPEGWFRNDIKLCHQVGKIFRNRSLSLDKTTLVLYGYSISEQKNHSKSKVKFSHFSFSVLSVDEGKVGILNVF